MIIFTQPKDSHFAMMPAQEEQILPVETLPVPGDVLFHDFFCKFTHNPWSTCVSLENVL